MFGLVSVSPALPPLIGCIVALGGLWAGWTTLRTQAVPPVLRPVIRLNVKLMGAAQGGVSGRKPAEDLSTDEARIYGYAWMYAGGVGLIVAGVQLVRLIVNA